LLNLVESEAEGPKPNERGNEPAFLKKQEAVQSSEQANFLMSKRRAAAEKLEIEKIIEVQ